MRTDTVSVRDRILAVLRDADGPLTTNAAGVYAGPCYEYRPNDCKPRSHDYDAWRASNSNVASIFWCDGTNHVWQMPLSCGNRCYNELRRFVRLGLVEQLRYAGHKSVAWRLVSLPEAMPELEALEVALWDAPPSV